MNRWVSMGLLCIAAAPALAGDLGVSVSLGQPGFYGQIDLGSAPQPQLVYTRPVLIERAPEFAAAPPIYLHVPPGHEKHWSRHCAEYHACGRPVYFVRDDWYQHEYVPRFHNDGRDHDMDRGRDREHEHDRGHGRDDGHDRDNH